MLRWKKKKNKSDVRLNYKIIWINSVIFLLVIYFIYHSLTGDRGVLAYFRLEKDLQIKNVVLSDLLQQKKILEDKVKAMHPQSLDVDMLDELARKQLGMIAPDEKVINIKPQDLDVD